MKFKTEYTHDHNIQNGKILPRWREKRGIVTICSCEEEERTSLLLLLRIPRTRSVKFFSNISQDDFFYSQARLEECNFTENEFIYGIFQTKVDPPLLEYKMAA